ncbi:hypothetical protein M2281_002392 [Mesorhizobium soli]|uniref:DUF982 domain-containing protein n=1 Tax=Pseudaminobacter soli (ex Li et al. 2025) TaxID=1295366 RepID=UPI00247555A6|nr:DUF982 domain-containing protein [Mesorhizobium soli]MDH6231794.1 hypothetical protein [Mesorhizobium soli]
MDHGWFRLVPITFGRGIVYKVDNVNQVANMLLTRWPMPDSPTQVAARRACFAFMNGSGTAEAVREAFERAAEEAGILVR